MGLELPAGVDIEIKLLIFGINQQAAGVMLASSQPITCIGGNKHAKCIIGKKIGMTQIFDETGK